MSWQAQTAVTRHSKQSNLKLYRLLHVLADEANKDGLVVYAPAQQALAEIFGCTDKTIRNWLNSLKESGELIQTKVGSGKGNPSSYQINLPIPESKGGNKAEENPPNDSTLSEFMAEIKVEISELKAEIDRLKVEISELKAEKVETKGGKGGNERWKAHSSKSSDIPSSSHLHPKEELREAPPTPQRGKRAVKPKSKKGYPVYEIPKELDTQPFRDSFEEWIKWRREDKRKPLSDLAAKKALKSLLPFGPVWAIQRMDKAIASGWTGLVYDGDIPNSNGNNGRNSNGRSLDQIINDVDLSEVGF